VQSGHDRNGNGRLDDDEVEHVDYVCGVALLTRLAAEPPGPRCIAGGVAFLVGRDRNGDGQLGDDEVEQTELACGDELARDVAIQSAADAAALANIAVIDGSLTVDGTALAELALPRLVQIRGAVVIVHDDQLAAISLPALQAIDGGFVVEHDPELASLDLPALRRTGGLSVVGDAQLADLADLAQLAEVRGDVRIADNERLGRAGLPLRRIDGSLTIEGNPALSRVAWLLLGPLGALRIASNPALHSVELPGFLDAPGTAAGSLGAVGEVTIASNAQLTDLSLTASDIAAIAIADNPALADVTLETVHVIGDVVVRGNGPLSLTIPGRPDSDCRIEGSLLLSGPVAKLSSSPQLQVTGDATFDATGLTSLAQANQIIAVSGALHLTGNAQLTDVSSALLDGGLDVRSNAALTSLAMRASVEIGGSVTIADNPVLQTAPVLDPALRIRGDVTLARNPALTAALGAVLLQIDGALVVDGDDRLAALGVAHLAHAGSIELAHCAALPALDLLALSDVGGGIDVRGNAALQHLRLPVLHQADLGVFDNPHLPACEVAALFAAMLGDHHQSGNDDTAVCGP
jgi:hypothetical protein